MSSGIRLGTFLGAGEPSIASLGRSVVSLRSPVPLPGPPDPAVGVSVVASFLHALKIMREAVPMARSSVGFILVVVLG